MKHWHLLAALVCFGSLAHASEYGPPLPAEDVPILVAQNIVQTMGASSAAPAVAAAEAKTCRPTTAYFQHACLSASGIQGQLIQGAVKTNASVQETTLLPAFYRNAKPTDPWWQPSMAPLAIGGSVGGGNAALNLGPVVDVGPQIIQGAEGLVGIFSAPAKSTMVQFFNCSASSTACGSLSVFLLANATIEQNGRFSRNWHELTAHPFGAGLGPAITFK